MTIRLTIKHDLDRLEDDLHRRLTDVRPVWHRFAQYMRARTDATFEALRLGGTFRGVTWKYFAPQYTRKGGRDGTGDRSTVKAWGGIPLVRGHGVVQGRMRPSGVRVREGDAIMQDTMTLRSRAALVMHVTPRSLILGPQGVRYAAAQQARRPFLFFDVPADVNQLERFAIDHLRGR